MVTSFRDKDTQALFRRQRVKRFQAFERSALRRLNMLHAATTLNDLRGAGTQLESLTRDRAGQHSIRINDQYRICFVWNDGNAEEVEITDYH